jgi:hypothetical protein
MPKTARTGRSLRTIADLRLQQRRVDRRRAGAATVLTAMERHGLTLHLHFSNSGPTWTLSNGVRVPPDVAQIVTSNLNVVGVGDTLFPGGVSQTWRFII